MQSQPLAYLMPEFLESDEARPLRILAEYLEPLRRFRDQDIQDTVVFFGSARDAGAASRRRRPLRRAAGVGGGRAERERAVKALAWSKYYEDARQLARRLTEWSLALECEHHRFVVLLGRRPRHHGSRQPRRARGRRQDHRPEHPPALRTGRRTPTSRAGLHFEFHYFFMRKFWFAYLAKALVIFPGGFGTLDELFEILTLVQTEKLSKQHRQSCCTGREYWDDILRLGPMAEWGAIAAPDLALLHRCDTVDAAFATLTRNLTEHHMTPAIEQERRAPGIAKTRADQSRHGRRAMGQSQDAEQPFAHRDEERR